MPIERWISSIRSVLDLALDLGIRFITNRRTIRANESFSGNCSLTLSAYSPRFVEFLLAL